MAKSSLSLKLLIDTQAKRVLFAKASKDCVDFLFHILSMPLATVINLLKKQGVVHSLANLYESTENVDESYIQPNKSKENLLKPVHPGQGSSGPLLLLNDGPCEKQFYRCGWCSGSKIRVSDDPSSVCPFCYHKMHISVQFVAPPGAKQASYEGGFVKDMVTYMVTTISNITILNKFNVKEVGSLEEKVVNLGMNEALDLLKASLQSERVLTDVFINAVIVLKNSV